MNNNIALIDGDHICYLFSNGPKKLDLEANPIKVEGKFQYEEQTLERVHRSIDSYLEYLKHDTQWTEYYGILAIGKSFRYNDNAEYKANRIGKEKPNFFHESFAYLEEKHGFHVIKEPYCKGYLETDDIVNLLKVNNEDCFIISPDKDLLRLYGNNFNPRTSTWYYASKEDAELFFWKSMIVGDSADGLGCLKGKGNAYCEKLFKFDSNLPIVVFNEYIKHYNDELIGIEEFRKNYISLKILNSINDKYKIENYFNQIK